VDKDFYIEQIKKSIEDLDHNLKELQEKHIRAALFIGYTREAIKHSGDSLLNYVSYAGDPQEILGVVGPSVRFYESLNAEVRDEISRTSLSDQRIHAIASSATNVLSSTSAVIDLTGDSSVLFFNGTTPAFQLEDRHEEYSKRFSGLSLALGQTYGAIDESLHATISDPERSALFLARQAFDQLLDVFAPVDEVRKSTFWKPKSEKEDKNPNAVWRIERIKYAAATHIKDKARATTLIAEADQILSVYNLLNKAHARGRIDQNAAVQAVKSMKLFLEEWIDALGT
jgi:hypothetical protein